MVKTKLQKLGVMSVAKFGGIYGLIIGLLTAVFLIVIGSFASGASEVQIQGILLYSAILWVPAFYGISGFLGGIIGGFLFNLIAKMSGGVEMHFIEMDEKKKAPKKV